MQNQLSENQFGEKVHQERKCSGPSVYNLHAKDDDHGFNRVRALTRNTINELLSLKLCTSKGHSYPLVSTFLENLLRSETVFEVEYINLHTISHQLNKIFHRILNDQNYCQYVSKDFPSLPLLAQTLEPLLDKFENNINQFDDEKCILQNNFFNTRNSDTSSGYLDDIIIPSKRPKLESSLVSYPFMVQPTTSERYQQLLQQQYPLVLWNDEVSVMHRKMPIDLSRVSLHPIENNCSNDYLNMDYKTMLVPSQRFITDKDTEKIRYSAGLWEDIENDSFYLNSTYVNLLNEGMEVEGQVRTELASSMCENVEKNSIYLDASNITLKSGCIEDKIQAKNISTEVDNDEQNSESILVPFKPSIVNNKTRKIRHSVSTCGTYDDMKYVSINLDSSNITCVNESMDVKEEVGIQVHEDLNKNSVLKADHEEKILLTKLENSGVSLIEFFTKAEIETHIRSLKPMNDLDASKIGRGIQENVCDLCSAEKLYLAQVPIYCSFCGYQIKPHASYFCTSEKNKMRYVLCSLCHKLAKKDNLPNMIMEVKNMCKMNNNEVTEEAWVECDRCERWQHQICSLYNKHKDLEGKTTYTCPKCLLEGFERREQRTLKGGMCAKDLRTTMLSDHIENRLFCRLNKDRERRAKMEEKRIDEIPVAEDLVVRVVSSVEKRLKVKKNFWDIFKRQNYPKEFPYRSKVIVVFQKIKGIDVCIFAMYVQEFGSECGPQNQRCVYISYLDSVKYFSPDIESHSGESLRTFVYQEVLIASLEFFKKRGFASSYIWACPPSKGEDYIFYCHPRDQKTPKADKLRKWYQSMLKKAAKKGIVVNVTNLYDRFFVTSGEHNLKVTATRLPYFDGDHWTIASENIIKSLVQSNDEDSVIKKNKQVTKRTMKAMRHENHSNCSTNDILLMERLGQEILSSKENFIIVQLQFFCIRCDKAILSGKRWFCDSCPKFQLCERCHAASSESSNRLDTHTTKNLEIHDLSQVEVDIPFCTSDDDIVVENGLFDNRLTFLDFCQKNQYQFDTLRRAKHSSMMIMYYLHNSELGPLGKACSICQTNILVNNSWKCEICLGFDVCTSCMEERGSLCHDHKLIQRSP